MRRNPEFRCRRTGKCSAKGFLLRTLMPRSTRTRRVHGLRAVVVAGLVATLLHPTAATASPLTVGNLDGYAGTSSAPCATSTQAGTTALATILRSSYPAIPAGTSVRACSYDQYLSDHSRGLAIDWSVAADSAAGKQTLAWLFQSDGSGNAHVRLRRLGISYIIWDNKIWSANNSSDRNRTSPDISTWRNYDSSSCKAKYTSADCGHVRHMHISLSDAGGARTTSWWKSFMDGHRDTPTGADPSAAPVLPERIVSVQSGAVQLKEGAIGASWTRVFDGAPVAEAAATPTRLAVLTTAGRLYLKDGPVNAPWVQLADNVVDVDLASERIGIVSSDGSASVKQGPWDAVWTTVASGGATAIDVTDERVGVVVNGSALVKEGPLDAVWTTVSGGVQELALDGDRVAVRKNGAVHVKEGSLGAGWVTVIASGAVDAELGGGRVAVRTADRVLVKEGSLGATWTTVTTGATQAVSVTAKRVGVVGSNGAVTIKEGPLNATWTQVGGQAFDFELA